MHQLKCQNQLKNPRRFLDNYKILIHYPITMENMEVDKQVLSFQIAVPHMVLKWKRKEMVLWLMLWLSHWGTKASSIHISQIYKKSKNAMILHLWPGIQLANKSLDQCQQLLGFVHKLWPAKKRNLSLKQ